MCVNLVLISENMSLHLINKLYVDNRKKVLSVFKKYKMAFSNDKHTYMHCFKVLRRTLWLKIEQALLD